MGVKLSISITQNSQSAANNSSDVTVKVTASWDYGSFNRNKKDGYLIVDGKKYPFAASFNEGEATTGSQVLYTWRDDITHGSTGAKTLACSASYTTGVSSGTITATASKTLTTIPRASTPTVSSSSVNMGSKVTINTNRASTGFTHDLAYSFAGGSYVSIATGVGDSYEWTTPDLASKIPSSTSGTVTIRCITKSGGTAIGTKTVTMTLKVPTNVVPSISAVSVVEATSGLAAQFGAFIKGKSTIKATITAAGAKGSTIKSYSTTFNGKTYTGNSWTSGAVSASGSLSLVTTVTDSRGRTAKKTTTITVLDYAKAVIDELHAYRVNAAGTADPNGVYIAVKYKASITSLNNKNTFSGKIEYKRSTATAWETLLLLVGDGSAPTVQGTAMPTNLTFSTDYQYDVRLSCSDYFGAASPYTVQLPSGAVILDIGADGLSLSIGKTAEHARTFDTAWEIKAHFGEIPKDALTIPATANLNDYTTPGYYVFSSASSATIANLPNGGSGSGAVEIIREGESNQVRQVVTRCSVAAREIWERLYYSNTWQEWLCIYKGGTGRVLWSGVYYMSAAQTVTLAEPVSKQPNGIVLVFSEYADGEAKNYTFKREFIDKASLARHSGASCTIPMCTSNLAYFAVKHLYIDDTSITGHANNEATGTGACGITYTNNRFVLRYVIGV